MRASAISGFILGEFTVIIGEVMTPSSYSVGSNKTVFFISSPYFGTADGSVAISSISVIISCMGGS